MSQKSFGFNPVVVKSGSSFKNAPRCHESHPSLKMGKGLFVGASCMYPRTGFEVYVGLDLTADSVRASDPWEVGGVVSVVYPIVDRSVPKDLVRFKKLVSWTCTQLQLGKKVHAGCFGGHGRTGLFLSAVYAEMNPKDHDAIAWVRANHCEKAVESIEQVKFLMSHYKVLTAKASDTGKHSSKYSSYDYGSKDSYPTSKAINSVSPVQSPKSIWADSKK